MISRELIVHLRNPYKLCHQRIKCLKRLARKLLLDNQMHDARPGTVVRFPIATSSSITLNRLIANIYASSFFCPCFGSIVITDQLKIIIFLLKLIKWQEGNNLGDYVSMNENNRKEISSLEKFLLGSAVLPKIIIEILERSLVINCNIVLAGNTSRKIFQPRNDNAKSVWLLSEST